MIDVPKYRKLANNIASMNKEKLIKYLTNHPNYRVALDRMVIDLELETAENSAVLDDWNRNVIINRHINGKN